MDVQPGYGFLDANSPASGRDVSSRVEHDDAGLVRLSPRLVRPSEVNADVEPGRRSVRVSQRRGPRQGWTWTANPEKLGSAFVGDAGRGSARGASFFSLRRHDMMSLSQSGNAPWSSNLQRVSRARSVPSSAVAAIFACPPPPPPVCSTFP